MKYFTVLPTLLFISTISFSQPVLKAWYKLDGNAVDSGDNGIDGILVGGEPGSNIFGHFGKALHFNGVDNFVQSDDLCQNWNPVEISVEAMIYPTLKEDGTSDAVFAFNKSTWGGPWWYNVFIVYYNSNLNHFVYFDTGNGNLVSSEIYPPEQWYCIQLNISDDGTGQLKINSEVALEFETSELPAHGDRFSIGQEYDGPNEPSSYFQGIIDEIKIYEGILPQNNTKTVCERFVSVDNTGFDSEINIYQNPAKETLIIEINDWQNEKIRTRFINTIGQEVLRASILSDKRVLNISEFQSGMYFLHFEDKNRNKLIKQIVIH